MKLLSSLSRMFGAQPAADIQIASPMPESAVYAIGDIHGRDDLLAKIIQIIDDDIAAHGHENPTIVLVGDYVDRGEQSAEVLNRIYELSHETSRNIVCLIGNHEEMMLRFVKEPSTGPRWLRNGGLQTLASFGIGGLSEASGEEQLNHAAASLNEALGQNLQAWLKDRPTTYQSGNVVIVHAALDPEKPLEEQSRRSLTWGHPNFLTTARSDGICVVHGHTIVDAAEVLATRIPIDTGAIYTGRLTALALAPDAPPRFLQT